MRARSSSERASARSGSPLPRSSSSSSSIPSSEASGVRSSCDAVETNARRACSCCSRRCCICSNARARSPTSSRARTAGTSTGGPSCASSVRRLAQPAQAADDRGRQRDAEDQRQREAGQRGVQERSAHGGHGVAEGVERFAHDQHPVVDGRILAAGCERDRRPRVLGVRRSSRTCSSAASCGTPWGRRCTRRPSRWAYPGRPRAAGGTSPRRPGSRAGRPRSRRS